MRPLKHGLRKGTLSHLPHSIGQAKSYGQCQSQEDQNKFDSKSEEQQNRMAKKHGYRKRKTGTNEANYHRGRKLM